MSAATGTLPMSQRNHLSTAPANLAPAAPDALPASVLAPLARIDPYLDEFIRAANLPVNLRDAILYSLLGPGKRIRPLLCLHSFRALGGSDEARALPAAAAVEMVHAFSLIHDDLPGLDNDDLRRGRPTLHKHAGEAMAILAGDSLLTLSFTILIERYEPAVAAFMARELAAGTNGMIAGQIYDTLGGFAGTPTPEQRLELIHTNKTGALIRAACRMGALAAGAGPATLQGISDYADAIGLMFQIVDDVLDVTQTSEHLGKKSGKDIDAGKLTYPGVMGIEASRRRVAQLHQAALTALRPMGDASEPLAHLAGYLAARTR